MTQLQAGAATYDITPPAGIDMCGFGHRPGPATDVHDPLKVKALYLEAGAGALILTSDLVGLDYDTVAEIRQGIGQEAGLSAEQIMINCSHTHGGPMTPCLPTMGEVDDRYMQELVRKFISVGKLAFNRSGDARIGYAREPVSVGINRREVGRRNTTEITPERGTIADWVDVLAVEDADGPLARLFVHAAHGVTLGSENTSITADWMGYAQRYVTSLSPGGVVALYGQGCSGNVNCDPRGSFEIADSQGRAMAGAVIKAAHRAVPAGDVRIKTARETLELPCFDPPSVQEAEKILDEVRADYEQAVSDDEYARVSVCEGLIEWAEWLVEQAEQQATDLSIDYEVQAVRIGDTVIVGLPGEVFIEYALNIETRSPIANTIVMGYTNGNPGYIPTAAAYDEGGYEVEGAYRFYEGGRTMITDQSERLILQAAESVLNAVL